LAAELKKHLGVESTLIAGSGGVFDVMVDGTVVFSKKSVGRFPEAAEIMGALKGK
jgi:selT/selW/selH-like putative selenoprotein